jgi:ATP-dependent Clp protease ATP-binding subunit ClpA
MSYTEELTQLIIEEYEADPSRATVDRLAEEHNKSTRSIIAKLSSAGVYQAPARVSKNGEPIVRKEDLAKEIGEWFGIEVPSLAKAGKLELQSLHKALSNADFIRAHLVDLEDEAA